MSIIGNFLAVPPEILKSLIDDASKVAGILPADGRWPESAHHLDVNKAWHGIHFLLTGDVWGGEGPLASVVLGGTPIGEDRAYGPVRYLRQDEVIEIAVALSHVSHHNLSKGYSPQAFETACICPMGIWENEGDGALHYLLHHYDKLVAFYKEAAARGDAVLLYIN